MLPTAGGGGPNAAYAAELSFEVDLSPARLLLQPTADGGTHSVLVSYEREEREGQAGGGG
ncbi:unnamed protein product [Ectocarpus sp. CCAP 1310/34]|nr:unnamed protein product [Ectocarpus sp. CCAP 1310/34]